MVWGCACGLDIIVRSFHIVNLVIFHPQYIDRGYLKCERNSSYSFVPIVLKRCMCVFFMVWGYASGLDITVRSFHILNLVIFHPQYIDRGYLKCERNSSYSFVPIVLKLCMCVFFMVWGCACGLDINIRSFFVIFSILWTWSFFTLNIWTVGTSPLTVLYQSLWNFACVFSMVWGCACGLDIIVRSFFVTFSTLWT